MTDTTNASVNLKHRLVGAVALVVLAVVLLPRLLTGTSGEGGGINANYTNGETRVQPTVISEIATIGTAPQERPDDTTIEVIDAVSSSELIISSSRDQQVRDADLSFKKIQIDLSSSPQIDLTRNTIVTGWIAQVGIFSQSDNVSRVVKDLRNDDMYPKLKVIETNGSKATMIWIGPYITKDEARREGNKAMLLTDSPPVIRLWPSNN
tara:strand:- start:1273 stop:1896 length:624 start_codon:yes stop_codon:yes gene_type:complete